jgi:hypothetical protein
LEWATKDLETRGPTSELNTLKTYRYCTRLIDVGLGTAKLVNCGFQGEI